MVDIDSILTDLHTENTLIDAIVRDLEPSSWSLPTPAVGWTIAHQIAHLHWTDAMSLLAIDRPDDFDLERDRQLADPDHYVDDAATDFLGTDPAELLARWTGTREALAARLAELDPTTSIPWYGPPMRPASMATARLMETWAHGQDITDTLGLAHPAGPGLRQIAHLGVRTRDFSFRIHGQHVPTDEIYVELTAPDGSLWRWGDPTATNSVTGPAEDFCLLVTQRRHRDDLALTARGAIAHQWMSVAQAFAGKATSGRAPLRPVTS
ncbi:TIGR03084 family protein [Gordonia paraffinivorans]|uniref:TIGR03084 family metal-binding protein n=1 Tax=Gordonia paraffinivorans TaxID=175628 RepID=UPI001C92DEBA|nr:TIGR03084 family metal-binding protein [Gordonia paraffinivorans]MBY4576087.1 TIGR03084 family protein [Gordonia paraffinivorans]